MAAFATASDMVARYDSRTLGDLCDDSGNRVAEADLSSNAKMTMALNTATGYVKAALLKSERYTETDLSNLTGESLDFLKDVTCVLAYWVLWRRRKWAGDKDPQRAEAKEHAEETLKMLGDGAWVLNVQGNIEAGRPNIDTATRIDITNNWELVADRIRGHLFPRRRTYRNR